MTVILRWNFKARYESEKSSLFSASQYTETQGGKKNQPERGIVIVVDTSERSRSAQEAAHVCQGKMRLSPEKEIPLHIHLHSVGTARYAVSPVPRNCNRFIL